MIDKKDLLQVIETQEKLLQFEKFSNEMAWDIGIMLVEKAKREHKAVTIDINRNGQQLFHYALEGTTADFDGWIQRKMKVVNRFAHSTHYMSLQLEQKNTTMEEGFLLDSREYAAHGGSFPITIKNTGVIGTITVSGLTSAEDHQLVVDVISEYLGIVL